MYSRLFIMNLSVNQDNLQRVTRTRNELWERRGEECCLTLICPLQNANHSKCEMPIVPCFKFWQRLTQVRSQITPLSSPTSTHTFHFHISTHIHNIQLMCLMWNLGWSWFLSLTEDCRLHTHTHTHTHTVHVDSNSTWQSRSWFAKYNTHTHMLDKYTICTFLHGYQLW